jgi:hypothetical protein
MKYNFSQWCKYWRTNFIRWWKTYFEIVQTDKKQKLSLK